MGRQPHQSLDPIGEVCVHQHESTKGWIEAMAFWQHDGDRVAAPADDRTNGCMLVMSPALGCITSGRGGTGNVARRDKCDQAGVCFQLPDDGSALGIIGGVNWEIAGPSGLG